jgi:hypothetical protein
MAQNSKAGIKLDDVALMNDIRAFSPAAADQYLEHVVVSKRNPSKDLHEKLLENLLAEAGTSVSDDGVRYHLEELGIIVCLR